MARVIYGTVCLCILFFIIIALIAMRRTKRVYFVVKTLSTMLLGTDCSTVILCFAIIEVSPDFKGIVLPFWALSLLLSFVVIVTMSVERSVALYFPLKYLKWTAKENRVIFIIVVAWLGISMFFISTRVGLCYAVRTSITFEACKDISLVFMKIFIAVVLSISLICHVLIYRIIRLKRKVMTRRITETSPQNMLRSIANRKFSSTTVSFLLANCLLIIYICMAVLHGLHISDTVLLTSFVCFTLLNSFLNSICYVWWFKECRMNILTMCSPLSLRLRRKVSVMRADVFDIVSYTRGRTEPQPTSA